MTQEENSKHLSFPFGAALGWRKERSERLKEQAEPAVLET